jgi:hypothetical protein
VTHLRTTNIDINFRLYNSNEEECPYCGSLISNTLRIENADVTSSTTDINSQSFFLSHTILGLEIGRISYDLIICLLFLFHVCIDGYSTKVSESEREVNAFSGFFVSSYL